MSFEGTLAPRQFLLRSPLPMCLVQLEGAPHLRHLPRVSHLDVTLTLRATQPLSVEVVQTAPNLRFSSENYVQKGSSEKLTKYFSELGHPSDVTIQAMSFDD